MPEQKKYGRLLRELCDYFAKVRVLMDCYTDFAAKASKYKNPINEVGVTIVYGVDEPEILEGETGLAFVKEHELTPAELIDELQGMERSVFRKIFGGRLSRKMYRLYEYKGL